MAYILASLLGLILGSFFNVVIARFGTESVVRGRSHCMHCRHTLAWYDLIPIVSFLLLKGRCRYCNQSISIRYMLLELLSGAVLVVIAALYGFTASAFLWGASSLVLVLLLFFDATYFILPDGLVIALGLLGLLDKILFHHDLLVPSLLIGFLLSFLFAILYVVSAGSWVGFGDVKLIFSLGLLLGYPHAVVVVVGAIWTATLVGLSLIIIRQAHWKTALPFGSFLAAMALAGIFLYERLFYFRYFF
ncbi:MAG: prepilin peptidase [Candidatus Yanofskybacteria bacterium]|nr:prepilin peptidase [Candidatus Yanofskybacteria bacterium]